MRLIGAGREGHIAEEDAGNLEVASWFADAEPQRALTLFEERSAMTGLNQLGVAMAQGEIAAVAIHNCLTKAENGR